jgi:hypothetical protein
MNSQAESLRAKLALEVSSMGHSSTSCARASAFAHAHTLWRNAGLLSQGAFEVRSRATELVNVFRSISPYRIDVRGLPRWLLDPAHEQPCGPIQLN